MSPKNFIPVLTVAVINFICCCYAQQQTLSNDTRRALNVSSLASLMCGLSHNCLHVPSSDMLVAYRTGINNDTLNFLIVGTKADWLKEKHPDEDNWALTVGIGRTPGMPKTFMFSCIHDGVESPPVWHVVGAYSVYRKIPRHIAALTRSVRNARMVLNEDTLRCSFSLPMTLAARNDSIDLRTEPVFLKLGRTYAAAACIGYHYQDKYISEQTFLMDMPGSSSSGSSNSKRNLSIIDYAAYETAAAKAVTEQRTRMEEIKIDPNNVPDFVKASSACGVTVGCQSLPSGSPCVTHAGDGSSADNHQCTSLVRYRAAADGISVTLVARRPPSVTGTDGWYAAVGISNTPSMEQSALLVCLTEGSAGPHRIISASGYANGAPEVQRDVATRLNLAPDTFVRIEGDRMLCNMTTTTLDLALRSQSPERAPIMLDLRRAHFLLMATGAVVNGVPQYHGAQNRFATPAKVSLTEF